MSPIEEAYEIKEQDSEGDGDGLPSSQTASEGEQAATEAGDEDVDTTAPVLQEEPQLRTDAQKVSPPKLPSPPAHVRPPVTDDEWYGMFPAMAAWPTSSPIVSDEPQAAQPRRAQGQQHGRKRGRGGSRQQRCRPQPQHAFFEQPSGWAVPWSIPQRRSYNPFSDFFW